jgi:hypothetical protein
MTCEGCLYREAVVWFDYKVGKHSGPGEVFIIPDMGDIKNQTQCKCHDRSITFLVVMGMCHETNPFLMYHISSEAACDPENFSESCQ